MDLAETGLTTHGAFEIFVNYWGVPDIVVFLPKTFLTLPLCDAISKPSFTSSSSLV
jgi:hypothetical protein